MVFFVDVIIIFGLLTYGGRDRYSLRGVARCART